MPESTESKTVIARNKQSKASKAATLDKLLNKTPATHEFSIYLQGDDGPEEATLKFKAIGARAYDALVSKFPPTKEQRAEGASFNIDTFAPALVAECSLEPEITQEQAKEMWVSETWSRGDLMVLFRNAVELNNKGIDIPFIVTD